MKFLLIVIIIVLGFGVIAINDRAMVPISTPVAPPSTSPGLRPKVTSLPAQITQTLLDVPFTAQAPFGEWSDPRQQDGCEEASVIMAIRWVRNETFASRQAAKEEILKLSHYQEDNYGEFHDTSAQDTASRLLKNYYNFTNYEVKEVNKVSDLITELQKGYLLIVPANGKALENPNFTDGGPDRHMLVIKGYNSATKQFITNDPGTRQGESYKYHEQVLFAALRDYKSGYHIAITEMHKVMIVVKK